MRLLLASLLFVGIASAQHERVNTQEGDGVITFYRPSTLTAQWRWSAASLAAAQVADAASSWRLQERNPLLRSSSGEFGAKGVAIKGATVAGMLLLESRLIRRHPSLSKPFALVNYIAAGVTSGIALRNWRTR